MKFMKLGSKADSFQADGDKFRYVATDLATDLAINIGDVKFHLHKFPLLSRSARLQKLVATSTNENSNEINIQDLPGGPTAFEICAKFCYGMTVTLNAYNVVAARCAAEYLEMYETVDKGNLIYKIEVFLNSSIFRSWKDSIIVLQTTRSYVPWSEELKVVSHCLDSIASMASVETSKVDWSYTYNRKKNGSDEIWSSSTRKTQTVPKDWWVEDLCEFRVDLYKRLITTIKTKDRVSSDVIGEALNAYALRRFPGFGNNKGIAKSNDEDVMKYRSLVETILWLLPSEKHSVSCSFLLKLLRTAIVLACGETERNELVNRIGQQLEEAKVADLLIRAPATTTTTTGMTTVFDVDVVQEIVEEFVAQDQKAQTMLPIEIEFHESRSPKFASDGSRGLVAKLVDGYLAEIARDPGLPLSKFVNLAETVSSFSRSSHDGLYRAIDMYLKEHPGISKSERKRICKLMNCRKLSSEACMHAVQNERLPLRLVVQVLFFEQVRSTTTTTTASSATILPHGSNNGSSTTNTEDDWDAIPTAEDIKALKTELAGSVGETKEHKMKRVVMSKMFSKLWSNKERNGEISSSSDTSESPGSGSVNAEETRSRRR